MEIPVRPLHTFPSEPKTLWGKLKKRWFPDKVDAYVKGRNYVDSELQTYGVINVVINRMWDQSAGGFNETEDHRLFDRGVRDRLTELNYFGN